MAAARSLAAEAAASAAVSSAHHATPLLPCAFTLTAIARRSSSRRFRTPFSYASMSILAHTAVRPATDTPSASVATMVSSGMISTRSLTSDSTLAVTRFAVDPAMLSSTTTCRRLPRLFGRLLELLDL